MENSDINLSVSSIHDIISHQASLLDGFKKSLDHQKAIFTISGTLDTDFNQVPSSNTTFFSVILRDLFDSTKILYLNVPKELVNNLRLNGYEFIQASGYIKINYFNNQFTPQFNVINIKVTSSNDLEEANKVFSSFFKNIERKQNSFPYYQPLSIAVIIPQSSTILSDFLSGMKLASSQYTYKDFPTSMHSKESLLSSLKLIAKNSHQYNVLVIIRGGGNKENINVFDDLDLCEALANLNLYKVIGIGHATDRVLIELAADFVATTPSIAGNHLYELFSNLDSHKQNHVEQAIDHITQEHKKTIETFESKSQQSLQDHQAQIDSLNVQINKNKKFIWSSLSINLVLFCGIIAFTLHLL